MFSGGQQLGRYRLLKRIATGGMGEIYLAEDSSIDRQVAIKVLRSEAALATGEGGTSDAVRLFEREAKAIAMLDHPHILPLYDYGEEKRDGTILTYLVMPYRPEGSLSSWLEQRGTANPLSLEDVESIITQTASALQYTHDHQLIHQDVKPSNFLIRANKDHPNRPDILISDFGIARLSNMTSGASQSIRGTPSYMAPEQWEGNALPASDQYALAVMAYELVTGRPLFKGTPMQMMFAHVNTTPPAPSSITPGLPPALDAVLLRGLAKQPVDRFPNISAFAQAFRQAVLASLTAQVTLTNPYVTTPIGLSGSSGVGTPDGFDAYTPLAITTEEALSGSNRLITLPDGSQITVSIPAGARDGQVLEVNNTGSPLSGMPTSVVRLKLSVQTVPQKRGSSVTQQRALPANDALTYFSGTENDVANQPLVLNGGATPGISNLSSGNAWGTPAAAPWQGGSVPPSPVPGSASSPSFAQTANPYNAQYAGSPPLQPSFVPFASTPSAPIFMPPSSPSLEHPPTRSRQRPNGLLVTLIVLFFLLVLSGGVLVYAMRGGLGGLAGNPTPTATASINVSATQTATAGQGQNADGTATADAQGTATADAQTNANATATADAQTNANATATAAATNPYGGTLAWSDPLSDDSQGHGWDVTSDSSVGNSCQFTDGAYHMIMPKDTAGVCLGESTSFDNFAFQVQMEFFSSGAQFSGGGLVFRSAGSNQYYVLEIFASGQYLFFSCNGNDCSHTIAGNPTSSQIPSFHTGLHQPNTIAVVAQGNTFSLYANGQQFAGPVTDDTYSSGLIGFYNEGGRATTEIAYSSAEVWQL